MQVVPRLETVVSSYFGGDSGAACSHSSAGTTDVYKQLSVHGPKKVCDSTESRRLDTASSRDASGTSTDCQVCGKSLSHLNAQRRLQHINRCLDKVCRCKMYYC